MAKHQNSIFQTQDRSRPSLRDSHLFRLGRNLRQIPQYTISIFRAMIYILPGVLFFSYQPLISLGTSESMNFELSLPLVWLVVFDILVLIIMGQKKILFKGWKK